MNKFFHGGYLKGYRTYIISGVGILSAIGGYLIGDMDVFGMLQTIFPLACLYFLRKGMQTGDETTKKEDRKKIEADHKTQKEI